MASKIAFNMLPAVLHIDGMGGGVVPELWGTVDRVTGGELDPAFAQAAEHELSLLLADAERGAATAPVDRVLRTLDVSGSTGTVRVPGRRQRVDVRCGALATGVAVRMGGGRGGSLPMRPTGAAVMAATVALAQERGAGSGRIRDAYAVGREVELRLASVLRALPRGRSWDGDGACGAVGAAIACARLDGAPFGTAAGIAASLTLGHLSARATAAWPLHAGWAAANGLLAATLARHRLSARGDVGADRGLLEVLGCGAASERVAALEAAVADIGARWRLCDVAAAGGERATTLRALAALLDER